MPGNTVARARIPWWAWIVAGDLVLLVLILFGGYWPRDPISKAILSWLAIQQEMNLAAWWSAAQLLLGALLMYERASIGSADERWPWAVLAVLSAGLAVDEVGSVHERLGDRSWRPLLVLAVPLLVGMVWALLRLARKPARRREVGLIVVAYVLFLGVAGLEYLESVVKWSAPPGMGPELEEGTELVGFLLLLFAAVGHRRAARDGLGTLIPDPMRMASLRSVLTLALVLHAAIALLFVPGLTDLYRRGNPIVGYPFAVYGLLACRAFTARNGAPTEDRRAWGWLAGIFLVSSIGAVFPLSNLAPHIDRVSPRWVYEGIYATYIFVIPAVLLFAGRLCGWQHRPLQGALAAFAVLFVPRLPGPIWWLDALTPALVVYLWTFVFLGPAATQAAAVAASRSEPALPA